MDKVVSGHLANSSKSMWFLQPEQRLGQCSCLLQFVIGMVVLWALKIQEVERKIREKIGRLCFLKADSILTISRTSDLEEDIIRILPADRVSKLYSIL